MKTILDELVMMGHKVTVLTTSASILIDPNKPSAIKFGTFSMSLTKDNLKHNIKHLVEKWTYLAKNSLWTYFSSLRSLFWELSDMLMNICKDVVSNKKLMTKLHESRFDAVLADAVGPCGELLAEVLKVPLVYSLRSSPGYSAEKYSGRLPLPPSYVPATFSELSDHVTFTERVKNMIYALYFDFWFQTFNENKWNHFYGEVLGKSYF